MGEYANYAVAAGQLIGGQSAKSSAFDEAKLLKRRGMQTRAGSQRAAADERQDARYLMSAARARAAASGGSTADESIVKVLAEIEARGEMNALTRLYDGELDAQSDEASAYISKRQGSAAAGIGTLAAVGSTFAGKYG